MAKASSFRKTKSSSKKEGQVSKSFLPPQAMPYAWALLILLCAWIAMGQSIDGAITNWDDEEYVSNNLLLQEEEGRVAKIFDPQNKVFGNYDPVNILTLAWDFDRAKQLDRTTGEYRIKAKPFHQTNLLIHLMNALLVFVFIFLLTERKVHVAGITALIFAIHPMHVESVAWISGRKDLVYTFFFLLALIAYTFHSTKRNWLMFGLCCLAFVLSAFSKPMAIVLPGVLLLIDYFNERKWEWLVLVEKIPFLMLGVWVAMQTLEGQAEIEAMSVDQAFTGFQKLLIASYGLFMYLWKFLVPIDLSAIYPFPKADSIPWYFYLMPLVLLAYLGLGVWLYKRLRWLAFAMGFFFVNVLLILQWKGFGAAIIADRFTYVAYIGIAFAVGMLFDYFHSSNDAKLQSKAKLIAIGIFGASSFFIWESRDQSLVWKNSFTLWDHVIELYPGKVAVAHNNRGLHYKQQGQLQSALADYDKAISAEPDFYLWYTNRGNAYRELAYTSENPSTYFLESINDLSRAVELKDDHAASWNSLGISHMEMGNNDEAIEDFGKAIEYDPEDKYPFLNRGTLYLNADRLDLAVLDFDEYLQLNPRDARIINLRGYAYFRIGEFNSAKEDLDLSITINPNEGNFYMLRAFTLDSLGLYEKALNDLHTAEGLGVPVDQQFVISLETKVQNQDKE